MQKLAFNHLIWLIHLPLSPLPFHRFYFPPFPALHHFLSPPKKSRSSDPCHCPARTNKHHVALLRMPLLLQHSLVTLADGMLNSYHAIIWVCPNHWLSPRLHLQSPTQLLSPTPTEVMWCTASRPSSVPPTRVCVRACVWCSHICVQPWADPGPSAEVILTWARVFLFFPLSCLYTSGTFQTGWKIWSHHFICSWHVCSPSCCLFSSFTGDFDSFQTLRTTLLHSLHLRFDHLKNKK